MTDKNDIKVTKTRPYLSNWSIWLRLGVFTTIMIISTNNTDLFQRLESIISQAENHYEKWGASQSMANPLLLIPFAAGGGLLATGSPMWSVLTMVAYALGYTFVIFATSLFAGLMKFTRQILVNSETVMRWGGLVLILMGGYYVVSGVLWFV